MEESETAQKPAPIEASKPSSSFAGDVLKLVSGTAVAQVASLLASPLLTRLFAPEAFGLLALFVSATSILGVVVCLRYEQAILLPDDDGEAANLLGASLLFNILITVLTVPVIWFGREWLLRPFGATELGPYLWLVPPMIFVSGVFLAFNLWNTRTKHFGRLSIARVTNSLTTTMANIVAGFAGYVTAGTLIGATVGGRAIASAVLGGQIWHSDRRLFLRSIRLRFMLDGIKRYRKFPLFDIWGTLLNNVSWQVPVFLLAYFFSQTEVGFYSLALRVIYLPMSLIGTALRQVFFQRASETGVNAESLASTTQMLFERLVALGLFPAVLLGLIGSEAFSVVFGAEWAEAGTYAQILSIWMVFWFISSPLSTIFTVRERQEHLLVVHIAIFATRIASLAIGGVLDDVHLALWLFTLSGAVVYGGLVFWNLLLAGVPAAVVVRALIRYFLYALPAAAPVLAGKIFNLEPVLLIGLAGLNLLIYYLLVMKQDLHRISFLEPVALLLGDQGD